MNLLTNKNFLLILPTFLILLLVPVFALAEGFNMMEKTLWFFVVQVFGRMAGLAGSLLDWSINEYIIGFGRVYLEGGVGEAIDLVWVSVRDIFNITFIFGLVYIGFKMILNSDDSNTRRWLVNLIMAAILVNFSLFFTKFVVDLSNILATQIVTSGFTAETNPESNAEGKVYYNISVAFMDNMGVNSALKVSPELQIALAQGDSTYGYIFGSGILFIVSTFVFGAGAMLLLIRFAVLLFYMVLSPFMFIGWVFPQLQRYTTEYWSGFLGRAFFAPLYLLLLYLSAQILQKFFANMNEAEYSKLFTGGGNDITAAMPSTLPVFAIACIFLIASLVVAQKMGANGAGAVMSAGKNITNRVKNRVNRAVVNTARTTASVAASPVTKSAGYVARSGSYYLGNKLDSSIKKMQDSGGVVGRVSSSVLVDDAFRGAANNLKNTRAGLKYTVDEAKKKKDAIDTRVNEDKTVTDAQAKLVNVTASTAELDKALQDLSDTVSKMSEDRLLSQGVKKLTTESFAMNLTENQLEALSKSGKISSSDMSQIKKAREDGINKTLSSGSIVDKNLNPNANDASFQNKQKERIFKGSVNNIGSLPVSVFMNAESYKYLTPTMLENRLKNGVSNSEKADIEDKLNTYLKSANSNSVKQWSNWTRNSNIGAGFNLPNATNDSAPTSSSEDSAPKTNFEIVGSIGEARGKGAHLP